VKHAVYIAMAVRHRLWPWIKPTKTRIEICAWPLTAGRTSLAADRLANGLRAISFFTTPGDFSALAVFAAAMFLANCMLLSEAVLRMAVARSPVSSSRIGTPIRACRCCAAHGTGTECGLSTWGGGGRMCANCGLNRLPSAVSCNAARRPLGNR
jgi:hypothetical protein